MPRQPIDVQRHIDEFLARISEPDAEVVLEGVMAACALIACADGKVTQDERQRVLSVAPRFTALRFLPQSALIRAFETATGWLEVAHADGRRRAMAAIGRVREHRTCRIPLLRACHAIATADSAFDRREREALISICGALDLDPAEFGLKARVRHGQSTAGTGRRETYFVDREEGEDGL